MTTNYLTSGSAVSRAYFRHLRERGLTVSEVSPYKDPGWWAFYDGWCASKEHEDYVQEFGHESSKDWLAGLDPHKEQP